MKLKSTIEYASAFAFGGAVYGAVETLWRGHTHPTMLFVGGFCFFVMYRINLKMRPNAIRAAFIGGAVITSAELLSGCVLNLWLGLNVWDYSGLRFNLAGQICLLYSFFWMLLSVPAFALCGVLEKASAYVRELYSAEPSLTASASSDSENSPSSL